MHKKEYYLNTLDKFGQKTDYSKDVILTLVEQENIKFARKQIKSTKT